jgi:hypothetical protein
MVFFSSRLPCQPRVFKYPSHDRILMDDVLAWSYTESEIQGINRCRLYLQVEGLSDICNADGVGLHPGIQAKSPTITLMSTIKWIRQRAIRPALVGNMAPILQNVHTRFIIQSATSNFRIMDATKPSELACIYATSSQMLCLEVSPSATTSTDTTASWLYDPAQVTHTR